MAWFNFSPVTPFTEGQIAEVEAFDDYARKVANATDGDDWDYTRPDTRIVAQWANELAVQGIFYEDGGYVKRG